MDKKEIFESLKRLLQKYSKGLDLKSEVVNSKAKGGKEQLHLYGKKKVSILNLPERQTYIAGVIMQKNFVGFYSMPLYSHPKELPLKSDLLKKAKKGKSCLNITNIDADSLKELEGHLKKGIVLYKKLGWI